MDGVIRIDKVVAVLDVWLDQTFPFAKMKVKVLERSPGDLLAVPNVAYRNSASGSIEYTAGIGSTVEESVNDLLVRFVAEVRQYAPEGGLSDVDFEWSAPEDF